MRQAAQQLSGSNTVTYRASAPLRACLLNGSRPLAPWPRQLCCSSTSISPDSKTSASKCCRQYKGSIRSQGWRSDSRSGSAVCCKAQPVSATAAVTASTVFGQLEPRVAFLAQLLSNGVLLPVLGGWLLVTALSAVASRARQVGPDLGRLGGLVGRCASRPLTQSCSDIKHVSSMCQARVKHVMTHTLSRCVC